MIENAAEAVLDVRVAVCQRIHAEPASHPRRRPVGDQNGVSQFDHSIGGGDFFLLRWPTPTPGVSFFGRKWA